MALGLSGDAVQQVNEPENYEFMIRVRDTTFAVDALRGKVLEGFLQLLVPIASESLD